MNVRSVCNFHFFSFRGGATSHPIAVPYAYPFGGNNSQQTRISSGKERTESLPQQRYNVVPLNDPYPEGVIVLLIVNENLYTSKGIIKGIYTLRVPLVMEL